MLSTSSSTAGRAFILPLIIACALLYIQSDAAQFSFVPGDYYTSNYFSDTITQYDAAGNVAGSLTLPSSDGSEVRGLSFGSDNLLYATVVTNTGFSVLALNSAGVPEQTYSGDVYVAGNLSYGKIAIDGQYLYVAGQDQLTRFLLGNPSSGTSIYTNNQVFDVKPLPNGDLFVASAYQVQEITTAGAVVRTLSLSSSDGLPINDIRGIEYNPATNALFVTELGHTGSFFQLLRYDATTGALEKETTFTYGDDMFLTLSGQLLVGSRTESPTFFDQDLNAGGMLQGGQQMFVTQFVSEAVPDTDSTLLLLGLGFLGIVFLARSKSWRLPYQCVSAATMDTVRWPSFHLTKGSSQ